MNTESGKSNKKLMGQRAETHTRMHVLYYELFHYLKVGQVHSFKATLNPKSITLNPKGL